MKEEPEVKEEILIIKRGGGGDEGHHGGAWKIAFADFMTAMMALFLVLWLVNAANEETKQAVASYFNPVKLVDRNRSTKGLLDAKGPQEADEDAEETEVAEEEEQSTPVAKLSDADLQANPYGVLAEIAAQPPDADTLAAIRIASGGGAAADSPDGEVFRDPFDPDFWRMEVEQAAAAPSAQVLAEGETEAEAEDTLDLASKTASVDPGAVDGPASELPAPGAAETGDQKKPGAAMDGDARAPGQADTGDETSPGEADEGDLERPGMAETGDRSKPGEAEEGTLAQPGSAIEGEQAKPGDAPEDAGDERGLKPAEMADDAEVPADPLDEAMTAQSDAERAEAQEQAEQKEAEDKEAEELRDTIDAVVKKIAGIDPDLAGSISVTSDEDGVLISLADELAIPMFNIGSAVPSRDLVLAMERIAAVLNQKTGKLRIYGHTDARPYRDDSYDNWRLSVARAQSAYFMLTRAGVPKARFSQVAGFADSRLRNPDQPEAAANRRIEILLERE